MTIRNHWMDRIVDGAFDERYDDEHQGRTRFRTLVLTGVGAAGKTFMAACIAMGWWLVDPLNSIAVLTSTTKDMIGKRIWPTISMLHGSMIDVPNRRRLKVGHMIESRRIIKATPDMRDDFEYSEEKHAIFAMAVAHGETQKAAHNLRGLHAKRMLLVIDEANGTPDAIYQTITNWRKACDEMLVILIGNPVSRLDPHGRALEPVDGWDSIGQNTFEWRTKRIAEWDMDGGVALRFDGQDSPNVVAGQTVFPYIYGWENWLAAKRKNENTLAYWSQDRGLHPPEGLLESVLNEPALTAANVDEQLMFIGDATLCGFLDPAFGGDAAVAKFGRCGQLPDGRVGLQIIGRREYEIKMAEPGEQADEPDKQVADQFSADCKHQGIKPENAGVDATGTGRGAYAFIATDWSHEVMRFEAANSPGDQPVMEGDQRPAKDVYGDRITESWVFVGATVRTGQLKGLNQADKVQFTTRLLVSRRTSRGKQRLEEKRDFKSRYGHSPDDADATSGLADLARQRLGLTIGGVTGKSGRAEWRELEKKWNAVYMTDEQLKEHAA